MTTATYYAAHRTEMVAAATAWQREHPERVKISQARYRVNHRKDARATMARWRTEHPEEKRAANAVYYIDHQAEQLAAHALWRAEHPEERRAHKTNYRHRKRANGGTFPRAAWEHLKTLFGHCCAYCGRRMARLTQDHIIPISKGGWHFSGNIVPACQSCNSRKGAGSCQGA